MGVKQLMEDFRRNCPGCHLAAYVDLTTEMVLGFDAETAPRQEQLNRLARTSQEVMKGQEASEIAANLGGNDHPYQAILFDQNELTVVMCRSIGSAEAVCCIASNPTELRILIEAGTKLLVAIDDLAT